MIAKVIPRDDHRAGSFETIRDYIADSRKAELVVLSNALISLDTAAIEMEAVHVKAPRVRHPIYHLVLSWPERDQPTHEDMVSATRVVLDNVGLRDHQWIASIHADTASPHIHIAANRIDPDTYKAVAPAFDYHVLSRTCRELETQYGWSHVDGVYTLREGPDGNAQMEYNAERSTARAGEATLPPAGNRQRRPSLRTWVASEPAVAVANVMARPDRSGPLIADTLAKYNLRLQPRRTGAVVVDADKPEMYHAKASGLGIDYSLLRLDFAAMKPEQSSAEDGRLRSYRRTSYDEDTPHQF